MPATLSDIARETQTSISTVSRVLSGGAAAARINVATRQRITEAAGRLGYRPNLVARSLRTRRSRTVALLVSDIANPWFAQIGSLVEQSLHQYGYSLMLCDSGEDLERESEYLQLLPQKGIDGLILVPVLHSRKALVDLLPANLPLVVLDRPIPGVPACVSSDQEQASNILCDTLARAGVKRIGLVCGPQVISTHRRRAELVAQRLTVAARYEGPAKRETGRQALIRFLNVRFDAIVCTNNLLAQGLIDAMADADDAPIIACYDEIPMMHLLPIPIVVSVQDLDMLADGCVKLLMSQLNADGQPLKPVVLPARAVTNRLFQLRQLKGA